MHRLLVIALTLAFSACSPSGPLGPEPAPSTAAETGLSEYEGQYEYENDTTLIMVRGPNDKILYASINGARYPLRPARRDVFLNNGDVEILFARDDHGKIIGYRESKSANLESNPLFRLLDRSKRLPSSIWHPRPEGAPQRYTYRTPEELSDGILTGSPGSNDPLIERLSTMVSEIYANSFPGVESVLLYRQGVLVFEEYFYAFDRDTPHQQRSATKTLLALLLGAALDTGQISSIDQEVLPFFDQYTNLQRVDDNKRAVTIHDLLSMQSGFDCDDWDQSSPGNESKMVYTNDWARFMLDLPMSETHGTKGSYCSGNVILIGKIIEKATGMPLKDYADKVLFKPLGISHYQWDFRPDHSNVNNYVQAWLRPRDMMKIGILLADKGIWNGQQVISAEWITQLTSKQSEIGNTPYGYFFWLRYLHSNGQHVEVPQMSGNGGQKVILLDQYQAILVLTGGGYNQPSHTNNLLSNYILPGLVLEPTVD